MAEGLDYDDRNGGCLIREPPHRRAPRRPRSPYPYAIASSTSQGSIIHHTTTSSSPLRALADRNINLQTQAPPSPSWKKISSRPSQPIKRPSSIRWDKNLPVPDRKGPASSVGFNRPSISSAQDASSSVNDHLCEKSLSAQASEDDEMGNDEGSRQPTAFGRPSAPMTRPYGEITCTNNPEVDDLQSDRGSSWEVSANGEGTSVVGSKPVRVKYADNSLFLPPSPWMAEWFESIRSEAVLSFSVDISKVHEDFDINPETGELTAKEPYPATIVDFEEQQSMNKMLRHHRQHKTSNWLIFRELESREREKKRQKQKQEDQERLRASVKVSRNQALMRKANKQSANAPRERPLGDCVFRPALLSDAKNCADIYNLAVEAHAALPDTNPVSLKRLESILIDSQREKLPFVVAAIHKADLTDAKNWPSLDAYRQYMKWKQTQPKEDQSSEPKIYGFGFLTPYEKGLAFGTGSATETVKAFVFVHPEHRRNGIGSALLHRLLMQTSVMFHADVQYEWVDPAAIQDSFHIPDFRSIHRIVMHVMIEGDSKEPEWMDRFMKSFQFDRVGRISQVYRIFKPQGVEWYDQVVWIHWANKINTGQTFYAGDESECSYDYPGKSQSPVLPQAEPIPVYKEFPNGPDYESDGADSY